MLFPPFRKSGDFLLLFPFQDLSHFLMNDSPGSSALDRPQKAMLLAAGQGTRLHPLTKTVPKCMIRIGGKPLLEHTIELLKGYQVTELMINLHHLPEAVTDYFQDGARWGVRIRYSREERLLGTAGAVKKVAAFFDGPFFVWYGDNLSACRLDRLWDFHRARQAVATIALYHREDPTQSGIVGLDADNRIVRFLEKPRPEQVFSHWVSAGIFALEPQVLEAIPSEGGPDFGRDVFPALLNQGAALYGYPLSQEESLMWVDTPGDLKKTEELTNGEKPSGGTFSVPSSH